MGIKNKFNFVKKLKTSTNPRRSNTIILATAVFLIAAILGGAAIYNHIQDQKLRSEKLSSTKLSQAVNKLFEEKKYSEAQTVINNSPTGSSKNNLLLLAQTYVGEKQYKLAEQTFQEVEKKYGLDQSLAANIAYAAENAKDNQTAISYYQKEITFLQAEKIPNIQLQVNSVQTNINRLQSGTGKGF